MHTIKPKRRIHKLMRHIQFALRDNFVLYSPFLSCLLILPFIMMRFDQTSIDLLWYKDKLLMEINCKWYNRKVQNHYFPNKYISILNLCFMIAPLLLNTWFIFSWKLQYDIFSASFITVCNTLCQIKVKI